MINIFPVEQVRAADAYTIAREPITSIHLMERAAQTIYEWIRPRINNTMPVEIYCGTGNNGGDGLALARMLHTDGIKVRVWMIRYAEHYSPDCEINLNRLKNSSPEIVHEITQIEELVQPSNNSMLIDALFGSGLSRPVTGLAAEVIGLINESTAITIALDMPSGLYCDHTTPSDETVVMADYTLTLQFPKLALFMPQNDHYAGAWEILPIGLHPEFIQNTPCKHYMITLSDIALLLKTRPKFSHKGNYGHALLLAGSKGKGGAALMAAGATLRSGAGLLTTGIPNTLITAMHIAHPEAMVAADPHSDYLTELPQLTSYTAIGMGPGCGTHEQTATLLKQLIQQSSIPLVLDADALNILSENKTWLSFLPQGTILTPHPKEFERLTSSNSDDFTQLEKAMHFAKKHQINLILKGAHTAICSSSGLCYINTTGNPGMATGGSGDILTGIILGLMAQHYTPLEAALAGVFIHGLAGDMASKELSEEALLPSDIINNLGKAFKIIHQK